MFGTISVQIYMTPDQEAWFASLADNAFIAALQTVRDAEIRMMPRGNENRKAKTIRVPFVANLKRLIERKRFTNGSIVYTALVKAGMPL